MSGTNVQVSNTALYTRTTSQFIRQLPSEYDELDDVNLTDRDEAIRTADIALRPVDKNEVPA